MSFLTATAPYTVKGLSEIFPFHISFHLRNRNLRNPLCHTICDLRLHQMQKRFAKLILIRKSCTSHILKIEKKYAVFQFQFLIKRVQDRCLAVLSRTVDRKIFMLQDQSLDQLLCPAVYIYHIMNIWKHTPLVLKLFLISFLLSHFIACLFYPVEAACYLWLKSTWTLSVIYPAASSPSARPSRTPSSNLSSIRWNHPGNTVLLHL